jgi:hypothetical protein
VEGFFFADLVFHYIRHFFVLVKGEKSVDICWRRVSEANGILRHKWRKSRVFVYFFTVDIFSGEPGESAQLKFALKISGEFFPIWANFVHSSAEEFADLGKFRPNRKKIARHFWGETRNNCCVHSYCLDVGTYSSLGYVK